MTTRPDAHIAFVDNPSSPTSGAALHFRDVITVTDLELRCAALQADLWQRDHKPQPLLLSLSIATDVSAEATNDSLLGNSLNYGTVTKAIETAVEALGVNHAPLALEVLAELIARVVLFAAHAPNVKLELSRPRALLSAESVGVVISRTSADYLALPTIAHPSPTDYHLLPASGSPRGDFFFVRALRRDVIIGVNPCERVDEQPVIVDLEFGVNDTMPYSGGTRAAWKDWRVAVRAVEKHMLEVKPLTIEAITTSIAQLVLTPPNAANPLSPTWNIPRTTVRLSKPCALMFARHPSVQVTRYRSDFFLASGALRHPSLARAMATSSIASSSRHDDRAWSEAGTESTAPTEGGDDFGGAGGGRVRTAVLAVGTNMGDRVGNISKALRDLERLENGSKTRVVDASFLYESEAMYVTDQAKFLNGVIKIETTLEPVPLLHALKTIELMLGREKTIQNGPRPIDLDILFYEDIVLDTREDDPAATAQNRWLKIPHASIAEREFVLRPLNDLLPDFVHPSLGQPTSALLASLMATTPTSLHRIIPLSASLAHTTGSRTLLMSILNATPDSFSDGGDNFSVDSGLANARKHVELNVDILDIGGMSTRPGAADVTEQEEASRVTALIEAIRQDGITTPISVDTFRPSVARAAIAAGADLINDVLGGSYPGMLEAMVDLDVPVILMHSRGMPQTMNSMTDYGGDVVSGVRSELGLRVRAALDAGVKRWNIVLDPGLGFAKTGKDNVVLLRHLPASLGRLEPSDPTTREEETFLASFPSLVGLSRKKFLGSLTGKAEPKERVWATAAAVTASIAGGTDIVRVHDVEMAKDVVAVSDAVWRTGKVAA